MAKYTYEQIKKAKSHFKYGIDCDIFQEPVLTHAKIALDALDLINRQEAEKAELQREIASYKSEIERLQRILDSYALQYGTAVDKDRLLKQAKSEAIKEFLEILKTKKQWDVDIPDYVFFDDIINITKEMVGESNVD